MQAPLRTVALLCFCHLPTPAWAQQEQRIEITGAKSQQRSRDTASIMVVSQEDLLRQGDRTLADALGRMPGITVGQGAKGSELRMRGLGNGYTQILLNGVAAPAGFGLDSIAPELVERVEIIRGASAELGMQSIAGAINIVLRKQASKARNDIKAGLDMVAGERAPSASWQWTTKGEVYSASLSAAVVRTAAPMSQQEQESGELDGRPLLRTRSEEVMNRRDALSLAPRISWQTGGGTLVWQAFGEAYHRVSGGVRHETALQGAPSEFPDNRSRVDLGGALMRSDLTWQQGLASDGRLEARIALTHNPRHSDYVFRSLAAGVEGTALRDGVRRVRADIREQGVAANGKVQRPLGGGHALTMGWDGGLTWRSQTRAEHDALTGADSDDRYHGGIQRVALYAQDEWEPRWGDAGAAGVWSLVAGLRWETLATEVKPEQAVSATRQRTAVASPVWQILYKPTPQHQWRAGLARTYKAPGMNDLIPRRYTTDNNNAPTNPDTQGNPLLRPEVAWGMDLGYDHPLGRDGKDGLLAASVYRRRIAGVTLPRLFQEGGRWIATPENQGSADAWGLTLEAKAAVGKTWTVRANLARNWSRVATVPGPDNRLDQQTPASAAIGLDWRGALWQGSAWQASADFNWQQGARTALARDYAVRSPSSRKLDLAAVWAITPSSRLRLGAANLLRQEQRSGSGYSSLGSSQGARQEWETTRGYATFRIGFEHAL